MREALASYVTRAGEKLRRDRRHSLHMMIFLHNSPFDAQEAYASHHASFQLPHPTSDTAELIHHACAAFARIYRPGIRYGKCGVMLTDLTPETENQANFLHTRDPARSKTLQDTVDAIDRRMDQDTVFYAAAGTRRDWSMASCSTPNWYRSYNAPRSPSHER